MVQALLNNINISSASTTKNNYVAEPESCTDFQKIFEKQTSVKDLKDKLGDIKENIDESLNKIKEAVKNVKEESGDEASLKNVQEEKDSTTVTDNLETDTEQKQVSLLEHDEEKVVVSEDGVTEEITENSETLIESQLQSVGLSQSLQTAAQSTMQPTEQKTQTVENNLETTTVEDDLNDDMTVTLNGKDLGSALEDFGFGKNNQETQLPDSSDAETLTQDIETEQTLDEEMVKELNIESIEAEGVNEGVNEGVGVNDVNGLIGKDDTLANSESTILQNQTPQEQGVKAAIQLENPAVELDVQPEIKPEVASGNQMTAKPTVTTDTSPSRIIEQITKQMESLNNGSKVNMVLNPESLGKVSIQIINTKEGLSAQFTVATQEARNLIMKGLDGLKDTLTSLGVNVDNVSVKMNENSQDGEYNADWTEQEGSRGGNKERGSSKQNEKEKEQFEQMMNFIENEKE